MKTQSEFWQNMGPIALRMWDERKSARQIGRVLNVSRNAVLGYMHRNGYGKSTNIPSSTLNICANSIKSGNDIYEVARDWGISVDTIKGHIKRLERMA